MGRLRIAGLFIPLSLILSTLGGGCGELEDFEFHRSALTAECMVTVVGRGSKQVESDYLPHVVACENGMADTEALKAQAIAARSYMYYRTGVSGKIEDGVSDQVYTCANKPIAKHYAAVDATSGQVILYSGQVICSFFVAGALPSSSSCVASASDLDSQPPTEWAVTYNEAKVGSQVTQSPLGSVDPTVTANRGCLSQNGSHCLSLQGKSYPEILKFYYGADIQITTASGSCVKIPDPPQLDASMPPPDPAEDGFSVRPDAESFGPEPSPLQDGGLQPADGLIPLTDKVEEGVEHSPSEMRSNPQELLGSCNLPGGHPASGSVLLFLLLVSWVRWSRAKSRHPR